MILGSVHLKCYLNHDTVIQFRYLIIDGYSKYVTGRIVTNHCEIVHIVGNFLKLPNNIEISLKIMA